MRKLLYVFLLISVLFLVGCKENVTVQFYDGEQLVKEVTVEKGSLVSPLSLTKEGYNFTGWKLNDQTFDPSKDQVTTNIRLDASWEQQEASSYIVTFIYGDNKTVNLTYKQNDKIIAPTDTNKTSDNMYNYVFSGWDKTFDLATGDMVITALYENVLKEYTITFLEEGSDRVIEVIKLKAGEKIVAPTNTDKAADEVYTYTFAGWSQDFDTATSDMTIYAKYDKVEIPLYDITFLDSYGEEIVTYKLPLGATIVPPTPPVIPEVGVIYYKFLEWENLQDTVTGDLVCEAIYEQLRHVFYTVSFYDDTVLLDTVTIRDDEQLTYDKPVVKKGSYTTTYVFTGWTRSLKTMVLYELGNKVERNMSLYAMFKEETNTNQFDFTKAKISILGDSISTFYSANSKINSYYTGKDEFYYPIYGTSVADGYSTWWGKTLLETKAQLGMNASLSGSCCYNWGSDTVWQPAMNDTRIKLLDDNGEPDIIIIFIGTNDNVNGFTNEQFENAYQTMLGKINSYYPNSYVFCCNLGYVNYSGYNYTEERRIDYNKIISKACDSFGATLIDIAGVQTTSTYQSMLGDSIHPSEAGMTVIARRVTDTLKKYFLG